MKQTWQPMQQFAHFCEAIYRGCYAAKPQAMIIGQSLSSGVLLLRLCEPASVPPIHLAPSLTIVSASIMKRIAVGCVAERPVVSKAKNSAHTSQGRACSER